MINQFFILSNRGDVLIKKDYRQDIHINLTEIFYREAQEEENQGNPSSTPKESTSTF